MLAFLLSYRINRPVCYCAPQRCYSWRKVSSEFQSRTRLCGFISPFQNREQRAYRRAPPLIRPLGQPSWNARAIKTSTTRGCNVLFEGPRAVQLGGSSVASSSLQPHLTQGPLHSSRHDTMFPTTSFTCTSYTVRNDRHKLRFRIMYWKTVDLSLSLSHNYSQVKKR